jgi:ribosomal-protein-alanine N-acetyltransferase
MEKMPYIPELDADIPTTQAATMTMSTAASEIVTSDWQASLPVLTGVQVALRELRASDAASLFAMLTSEEVSRFISPPPTTIEGFERFIAWTLRERAAGKYVCYAVTIKGYDTAIGIFQVRELEPCFSTAEWGFAIASAFWGTGVFQESAELVMEFAFETLGVHRLEARAAVKNGRGNGALLKIGAVQEGLLRRSFLKNGEFVDQVLYAIVEDDWRDIRNDMDQDLAFSNVH